MSSDQLRDKLDKTAMLEAVAELVKPAIVKALSDATRTCLTCDYFKEHQGEVCGFYNNQRPPAKIIAFGCPSYENIIPF